MGIKEQNKSLSDAASTPKDTSPRKEKAQKDSNEVIEAQRNKKQAVESSKESIKNASETRTRPSFEGLTYAPAAHIQMNNTGYANPQMQKARYAKKQILNNNFNYLNFTSGRKSSIINNYTSMTQKESSSYRINNIVQNNMMFK